MLTVGSSDLKSSQDKLRQSIVTLLFKINALLVNTRMAISSCFFVLCFLFISVSANVQNKVAQNPADELVTAINSNRTASNSSSLYSNTGLACIALQYIKAYQGDCGVVGGSNARKPDDSQFTETFAPNCGIEAATLTQITGRLLGCQSHYVNPSLAFSDILMENNRSVEILRSRNHTEIGAAVSGSDGGGPYFWCVLFSNGSTNSSFVLEGGVAKISRPGCFSGANDDCSGAVALLRSVNLLAIAAAGFLALACGWKF